MKVILGAGGYLGSILSHSFHSCNHSVLTVSRSFQWSKLPQEQRILAPVSSGHLFIPSIQNGADIIYMAGATNLLDSERNPSHDLCFHVSEMESFFTQLKECEIVPNRLIFVSSAGAVYGDSDGKAMSEFSPLRPKSVYGKRNLLLENLFLVNSILQGIPHVIVRVSNPYGPTQKFFRRQGLIHTLINSSLTGKLVTLRGGGLQKRDYISSDSFSRVFGKLLDFSSPPQIINVCSGQSYTALEIIDKLRSVGIRPNFVISSDQPSYEVKDSILSNALLDSLLGYTFMQDLTIDSLF